MPQITTGATIAVVELAAGFWTWASEYYSRDGKPTGHVHLIKSALHAVRELYGTLPAAEFGPLCLSAVQQRLVDEGKARTYVNHLVQVIRQMFKWGVSKELVPVAVHQALATLPGLKRGRTAARETVPVGLVEDFVVEATITFLPIVVADMVRLQRLTGCRPGELCSMRPCDIDQSTDPWVYRPASQKTQHLGKDRLIHIGPKAQEVLRPYLLRPGDAYCFSPADSEAKRREEMRERRKTRVQPSQASRAKRRPLRAPGNQYGTDAYSYAIRRGCGPGESGQAGRRQAASLAPQPATPQPATEIRRLYGLEAAQVTLGHSRADVTQVYAERDGKLAAEIARKIG